MRKNIILKNSIRGNIWMLKYIIFFNVLAFVIWSYFLTTYGILGLFIMLGFIDIVLLGLLGVFIHVQYFLFEKERVVNISGNTARFFYKGKMMKEVDENDIDRIILIDKMMNGGNSFPTFVDSYFFL